MHGFVSNGDARSRGSSTSCRTNNPTEIVPPVLDAHLGVREHLTVMSAPGRHPCHQHTGVLPPYLLTSIKSAACGTPSESSVEAPTLCSHVGRRECPKADLLFRDEAANDQKAPARQSAMQTPEAYRCFGLTLSVSKRSGPVRAVAKPLRHP
jgi:hypothetical protein